MKSDKHLLMLLFAIYLFAIIAVVVGAGSEFITTALKSGANEAWLGFAGSIIGGLITAGAGTAAWIAAQRTINSARAVAERREILARNPAREQKLDGNQAKWRSAHPIDW